MIIELQPFLGRVGIIAPNFHFPEKKKNKQDYRFWFS